MNNYNEAVGTSIPYNKMIVHHPSFLLFIEPNKSASDPIIDVYTRKLTGAFRNAKSGRCEKDPEPMFYHNDSWKGWHSCSCGKAESTAHDYLIETGENTFVKVVTEGDNTCVVQAVITNSLCIHYVACHRKEIPQRVLDKILLLKGAEAYPSIEELNFNAR